MCFMCLIFSTKASTPTAKHSSRQAVTMHPPVQETGRFRQPSLWFFAAGFPPDPEGEDQ